MNEPFFTIARPRVISDVPDLRLAVAAARAAGKSIGLVPTMGALHDGHLRLVQAAAADCEFTVVTIFVNPTQFGPRDDFQQYPRDLEADLELLAPFDIDVVFAPSTEVIYPDGFSTYVEPPAVARRWEGECRPGHFRGVATVVLKLFHMIPADSAFFGQKDFQQSVMIRQMVDDLDLPIRIRVCPTVREPDGLARSSRNAYLDHAEREQAVALSRGLRAAVELAARGERRGPVLAQRVREILADAGIADVDYVAIADPETLEPVEVLDRRAIALVAARVGTARLIDNMYIGG